jgi:hypothetical protein
MPGGGSGVDGEGVLGKLPTPGCAFALVFLLHVGVQGFFLPLLDSRHVMPHTRYEVTAVAMSLYERGTFADPYCLPTGPTAHMPPFHPALIAAIYHLLGPTLAAGYVTWLVLIACHGAMWAMLPWLAARLGLSPGAGLLAGIVGALVPRWPGYAEAPSAIAIGLMLAAFPARWKGSGPSRTGSLLLGTAIGAALHVSPSLLPVALGLLAWEALGAARRPGLLRSALVVAGMALACVPWTLRNERAFGGLFFLRSNFGLELRMGNHEGAGANLDLSARGGTERHPRTDEDEARRVAELGERAYMRAAGREAKAWIAAHPGEFLRLTALRVVQFWLGPVGDAAAMAAISLLTLLSAVGASRTFPSLSNDRRAALLVPFLLFPLVYYVVGFEARYRQPLDGLAFLLAASAFLPPRAGDGTPGPSPGRAPESANGGGLH